MSLMKEKSPMDMLVASITVCEESGGACLFVKSRLNLCFSNPLLAGNYCRISLTGLTGIKVCIG